MTDRTAGRLAIAAQKGGVGKTTTTKNLAGALNALGNDVLAVDLDPQGHLSEGLGFDESYTKDVKSLFDVLPDLQRQDELDDLIREHPEMDVVPSHQDMINIEDALSSVANREKRLAMCLDELQRDYDHVLIDCPPNLGVLTDNAILAAPNVLIPAEAKSTSIRALEILFRQFRGLESAFADTEIRELALVANEVIDDGEADEMMDWFKENFEDKRDIPVFEVRKRVALQRAWNNGVSIFEHEESCDMEDVYLAIAEHLEGFDER